MKPPQILLLEDELQLAKVVSETLQRQGYMVTHSKNGRIGLDMFFQCNFDLCIVDVMMPFMDGFSFVKELRRIDKNIPVLFLTARSRDIDVIEGYHTGGNDYLKKPFSLEELILRIQELLKRGSFYAAQCNQQYAIGSFDFFVSRQELINKTGNIIKLSHRECELLHLLMQYKNQLLERRMALIKLWGDDNPFNARTMDVFITKIRKHLQTDNSIEIINVRGLGYKLLLK